ncbi:hypothetical protein PSEUDO9AG_50670 [Pseudomonas sp. 9Ag]|nr:hypothetical protein PSEUDO9AG_50670 [Pseudomonas sp. 9Ag]
MIAMAVMTVSMQPGVPLQPSRPRRRAATPTEGSLVSQTNLWETLATLSGPDVNIQAFGSRGPPRCAASSPLCLNEHAQTKRGFHGNDSR